MTNAVSSSNKGSPPLPDRLTVRYILDTIHNDMSTAGDGDDNESAYAGDNPKQYLQDNGVMIVPNDNELYVVSAASALRRNAHGTSFWRQHCTLHPNYRRVKSWLWAHERYRAQARALVQIDKKPKLLKAFTKFHKKMEKHSDFEDAQLFAFFLNNDQTNASLRAALQELKQQHTEIRLAREIMDGLQGNDKVTDATREQLQTYVDELLAHVDLEERTLVGPWMQLSDSDYKTYRSGLSCAYWIMY